MIAQAVNGKRKKDRCAIVSDGHTGPDQVKPDSFCAALPADIPRLAARAPELSDALRSIGFAYVSLDLRGYRTGSLNEALGASVRSDE